ncbi:MAG: hypothetical protein AAF718_01160 [Pseudomonadota bacterium]
MQHRKPRARDVSPAKEDRGLYKSAVVDVSLTLTPFSKRSSRGDHIYMGAINGTDVEVVFPGRRAEKIDALRHAFSKKKAAKPGDASLKFQARGVWRTRLVERDGMETERVYQFLVSEWIVPSDNGEGVLFGEPPLKS